MEVGGGWSTLEANSVDLVVEDLVIKVFVNQMLRDLEMLSYLLQESRA